MEWVKTIISAVVSGIIKIFSSWRTEKELEEVKSKKDAYDGVEDSKEQETDLQKNLKDEMERAKIEEEKKWDDK